MAMVAPGVAKQYPPRLAIAAGFWRRLGEKGFERAEARGPWFLVEDVRTVCYRLTLFSAQTEPGLDRGFLESSRARQS